MIRARQVQRRLLPAPSDILFILFLAALPLARGWQAINTDGDLGRHLRVGSDILAEGLFFTDRYSWTMQGQPFVPFEWLSEVLFALSHRLAGFNGVLVLCGLIVAATVWLLMLWFRRKGVDTSLAFLASAAAGLAGSFHWLARPHLWSLLGAVAVLLLAGSTAGRLDGSSAPRRSWKHLILAGIVFAAWANLHGGFLFGLVLLALLAAGDALDWLSGGTTKGPASLYRTLSLLGAGVVGACINPVGARIFPHVIGYLDNTWLIAMTMEYRSPDFHMWWGKLFLMLLAVSIGSIALIRRPVPWRTLVPFIMTMTFALHSARNIPLWSLSGLPLLVAHLDADWRQLASPTALAGRLIQRLQNSFAIANAELRAGSWLAVGVAASFLMALCLPPHPGFDPAVFPVDAVARARAEGVTGRMFNELAWGGYILYAWPEQKVFIDAQTDFYGQSLAQQYASIRAAESGWDDELTNRHITLLLLPADAPVARILLGNPVWKCSTEVDEPLLCERV